MSDEICHEFDAALGGECGQRRDTHEHLSFDLDKDKDALARIREFLEISVEQKSDEQLLAELRDGGKSVFRVMRWRKLPTVAFRRSRD